MEDIKNKTNDQVNDTPDTPNIVVIDTPTTTPKRYKKVIRRVKKGPSTVTKKEIEKAADEGLAKPANKVRKFIILGAFVLIVLFTIAFVGKMFLEDVSPVEPDITITKPVNMDGEKTIGQYSVNVYKNIIIGRNPFVFNNAKTNDAEICYTIMCDGVEMFSTDFLAPGDAISWLPEVEEHGKTYNCHVIVTARDITTKAELNSLDIRQLIYIDKNLPQTTSPSDFKYTVVVDNYSNATVIDGYVYIGYEVAVHENPAHPLKPGDKIDVRVPETVIVNGHGEEIEVTTNDFEVKECNNKYIYMVGYSVIEDVYDIDYEMTTRYNISGYERYSNGIFDFGQ